MKHARNISNDMKSARNAISPEISARYTIASLLSARDLQSSGAANAARIETRFTAMFPNQTASDSLHPPVIAGVSRVGRVGGFLCPMKTEEEKKRILETLSRALDAKAHPLIHIGFALEFITTMIEASEQHAAGEIESVDLCDICPFVAGEVTAAIYGFALKPLPWPPKE